MESIKLYGINTLVIMLSFSHIESALKLVLLLLSIVYTAFKIIELIKTKNK
tara:strand:+ start:45 stop:197 length:153 start_codon:yes stop_codon:yes gene_type:complete